MSNNYLCRKINFKLDDNFKYKTSKIQLYNKKILLELILKLNTTYFQNDQKNIIQNFNNFFNKQNLIKDITPKALNTIISFQHILITSYTSFFGLLTIKNNIDILSKKKEEIFGYVKTFEDPIDNLILDSGILKQNLFFFQNNIYLINNNYYFVICLLIVLDIINFKTCLLCFKNKIVLKHNNKTFYILKDLDNSNYVNKFKNLFLLENSLKIGLDIDDINLTNIILEKNLKNEENNSYLGIIKRNNNSVTFQTNIITKNNKNKKSKSGLFYYACISYYFYMIIYENYQLKINNPTVIDKWILNKKDKKIEYDIISIEENIIICFFK